MAQLQFKKYTVFVALLDDFDGSADDLVSEWQAENPNVYIIDFELPEDADARTVVLVGRGLLWEAQWTEQGTVSTIVEDLSPDV